jgi:hypothetical protein
VKGSSTFFGSLMACKILISSSNSTKTRTLDDGK